MKKPTDINKFRAAKAKRYWTCIYCKTKNLEDNNMCGGCAEFDTSNTPIESKSDQEILEDLDNK